MDLYQIFIEHNRPWTTREIVCFLVVFIAVTIIVGYMWRKKQIFLVQALAVLVLVIFLGIVFGSTVFTRVPEPRKYELELFWSWKFYFRTHSQNMLREILLNCILLFPMGMLLPIIFNKKIKWWKALLLGVFVSAGIELSQLVFCRGLFEFDDIIHNSLGCMLGSLAINIVIVCMEAIIKRFPKKKL